MDLITQIITWTSLCVYIYGCVYTRIQKHPCQPLDPDMRRKKRHTHLYSNDEQEKTHRNFDGTSDYCFLQAKWLNEYISIVQFPSGSITAVTEIWNLLLELFLKSGPRLCMTHVLISEQTGRSNILYGKDFSAKLIISNLGGEAGKQFWDLGKYCPVCQDHFNDILKVVSVLSDMQHVFHFFSYDLVKGRIK